MNKKEKWQKIIPMIMRQRFWRMAFELKTKHWSKGTHAKGWKKNTIGRRNSKWNSEQACSEMRPAQWRELKETVEVSACIHKVAWQERARVEPSWWFGPREGSSTSTAFIIPEFSPPPKNQRCLLWEWWIAPKSWLWGKEVGICGPSFSHHLFPHDTYAQRRHIFWSVLSHTHSSF